MDSFDLIGRHAIITGAAGGIGLAIASQLERSGAVVTVIDRDEERLVAAAQAHLTPQATILTGNVSIAAEVETLIDRAASAMGGLDILINNAGMPEPLVATVDQDPTVWQQIIDVNLRGVYLMSRAFGRHAVGRVEYGAIVNIASVVGMGGFPASNAYGPSKAAVVHLTKSMACEWSRRGIRVNCVAPGFIDAPMAHGFFAAGLDRGKVEKRVPMRRLGKTEEIATVVAFLVADSASYLTGAVIPVDGGWCAYSGL